MRSSLAYVLIALCLAHEASAQTQQDIERAQLQNQQLLQQQMQLERQQREFEEGRRRTPSGADLRVKPSAVPQTTDGTCSTVTAIVLDGATQVDDETHKALSAPYLGRCLTLADINVLIAAITNHYVERGFVTTRVYLPQQDLSSGRLELKVVEGRVQSLRMQPPDSGSTATTFPDLVVGILNLRDLEQGIDQLNRLGSNSARLDIEPGDDPGTSNVVIRNEPRKRWLASAGVDNSGSASTGSNIFNVSLGLDNPLALNDYLNLNARHSASDQTPAGASDSAGVSWNVPYGYWTYAAAINTYNYQSMVRGQITTFKTEGKSDSQMLRADRVVYRDQSSKWSAGGGITQKQVLNQIAGIPIDVSSANLTVLDLSTNASVIARDSVISVNAGLFSGIKEWGATTDDPTRPVGAPRAQYTKFVYGASLFRSFSAGGVPLTWQTLVSGQYAQDPLYGVEQMAIGSLYTVRGFQTTSLSGRSGVYVRNELGMPLPMPRLFGMDAPRGQIRPYLGFDFGHINDTGSLQGWAAGVDLTLSNVALQIAYSQPVYVPESLTRESGWLYARLALTY